MSVKEEIDKAIAAHGQWKQKLRDAIDSGSCESTPDRVKQDNNCSFGKWLHYRIDPSVKSSEQYNEILKLHADFHREAGAILEIALNGDAQTATERMKIGGDFARLSAEMTRKLTSWRDTL